MGRKRQADLFAQLAELKVLGHPLPTKTNVGGTMIFSMISRARCHRRNFGPVIRTIARKLMVDGVVLPKDFDRMTQMGNASC